MAERTAIPDDLAARVLFASDRTCCVCRSERQKIQIHHIDEDSSNNSFDNLAVVCLFCHVDSHSKIAFSRNLNAAEIRLYNASWRDIVKLRLLPAADSPAKLELASEGYLEATLTCIDWVSQLAELIDLASLIKPGVVADLWHLIMVCDWQHREDDFQRFMPLMDGGLTLVQSRLLRIIQLFPHVLPHDFQAMLWRSSRQIEGASWTYKVLLAMPENQGPFFIREHARLASRILMCLHRDSEWRRQSMLGSVKSTDNA